MQTYPCNMGVLTNWKAVDMIYTHPEKSSKLFLGNIGGLTDQIFLLENKIKAIASICEEVISPTKTDGIEEHLRIPIADRETTSIIEELDRVYEFIERNLNEGKSVLVHCMAGASRSASFVIAYLMKKNAWCFEKTYLHVKNIRGQVGPNSGFQRQLRMYEKKLNLIN